MAAIYSNGSNRWNILGFNFTKRDALSSVYKISMTSTGSLGITFPPKNAFIGNAVLAFENYMEEIY